MSDFTKEDLLLGKYYLAEADGYDAQERAHDKTRQAIQLAQKNIQLEEEILNLKRLNVRAHQKVFDEKYTEFMREFHELYGIALADVDLDKELLALDEKGAGDEGA